MLHDRLLALHGGKAGVREEELLRSALARPQQHFAYAEAADIIDIAMVYTAGIVPTIPLSMATSALALSLEFSFSNLMAIE